MAAEQNLTAEHERHRLILELATEGFWEWDLASDRAYLSPRYCQMVGYAPEETVFDGDFFRSIIHPDDRERVCGVIGEQIRGRRDLSVMEYRMICRNGTVRLVEGRGTTIAYDREGRPTRIAGTIIDIGDRRRGEESFHFLASKLPDIVVARFDRQLRHLYVNDSIERVTGQPRESFIGKTNRELGMPEDLLQLWDGALNSVWETGQARQIEFSYPAPDGRLISYECNLIPDLSDRDTISSVICINRDVSERRQAELLLQQSEEKFRMTFEGASDAIFWADADSGVLINCNRAAEAMLELPREEIIGKHQTFLHPPELADHFATQFRWTVAQHREVNSAEAIVVSRSGRRIPVHIKHSVTCVGERNIMQGLFRDVTEQKRSEEELLDLNRKLRALGEHLQTVQEQERLAMARDIHDEIGQSLTVLKLDLEWIERRLPADGPMLERVSEMHSHIEQLTSSIQRIAADLRPPLLDNLGLAAAIDWQVAEFRRRSGIECFAMLNEEIGHLAPGVSTAVVRIVQEGLTNVLRHAHATEVSVSLCTRSGQLVVEIGDNGRGIRPEEIGSPRAYGLMGMQERARICKGQLEIGGAEGGGTLLRLSIPLPEEERPL